MHEDVVIRATFREKAPELFSVTLTKNFTEEMGTASLSAPKSGELYEKEELVTLSVTVNDGYLVDSLTVGGEEQELDEDGKYSFKVRGETAVTVSMRAIRYYSVSVKGFLPSEGSVDLSPAAEDGRYREGTEIVATLTPAKGYKLRSFKQNGADVPLGEDRAHYTFVPQEDTELEAVFSPLESFSVTVEFDETMCDVTYIGEDGEAVSIKGGAEFDEDRELTLTVQLVGGYRLVSATVNGKEATLSGNGFSLTVTEKLRIVVVCEWVVTKLDALAGEYDLKDDVWYTFTLAEEAAFDFSASNYAAYAAFYKTERVEEPKKGEKGDKPVWIFNEHERTAKDVHAFEAGLYVARFSSNTGDGVAPSKLSIAQIPPLGFEITGFAATSYVSLDGQYKLYMGAHYLAVKDKDGNTVNVEVTRTTDEKGTHINIKLGGETYVLGTQKAELASGSGTSIDGLTVVFFNDRKRINFRPDPLPKDVTIAEKLEGIYTGEDDDGPVEGDLIVSGNTITWGEKAITLLKTLEPVLDGKTEEISARLSIGYCEEEFYILLAEQNAAGAYEITLMTGDKTIVFSPKKEESVVTIDEQFHGTWTCRVATAVLSGYTLEISEHDIVVKDGAGQTVQTVLGTYLYRGVVYPTFTVEDVTYFLYNVRVSLYLTVYPTTGQMTGITFVKVT